MLDKNDAAFSKRPKTLDGLMFETPYASYRNEHSHDHSTLVNSLEFRHYQEIASIGISINAVLKHIKRNKFDRKDKYMFKKEIHDFLLANGFKYVKNAIAPYCRNQNYIWAHVYVHVKLNIYGDCTHDLSKVFTADYQRRDVYPLFSQSVNKVTLDIVKETLKNGGIEIKDKSRQVNGINFDYIIHDDLMDSTAYLFKGLEDSPQLKWMKMSEQMHRWRKTERLNTSSGFMDKYFKKENKMEQEYQEITMDNLAETLEYNGAKEDKLGTELFYHFVYSLNGVYIYWNEDCTINASTGVIGDYALQENKANLQDFIAYVEIKIGKLERLPKVKFNHQQYLQKKILDAVVYIQEERLSFMSSVGGYYFNFTDKPYTREECDKIIKVVQDIKELVKC